MKKLSLQIDKKNLESIKNGDIKEVHRYIYPNNADRYVIQEETEEPDGEILLKVIPVHYDAISFTNGRRKDSPRLTVEVKNAEFVVITDNDDNDLTFEENGEEYLVCQVWYELGEIINIENF